MTRDGFTCTSAACFPMLLDPQVSNSGLVTFTRLTYACLWCYGESREFRGVE